MTGGHESVQRIHLSSERNPLVFMLVQKNIRTLVLVPTPLELNSLLTHFAPPSDTLVAPCGFGVVGSSSVTQSLLQTHRPQQVILAGIAGTMSDKLLPSEVCAFDSVILDGVGVQEAEQLSSPHDLGFSHGYETSAPHRPYGEACLPLTPCPHLANAGTLLTVCAASGTMELAERRRQCYPQATRKLLPKTWKVTPWHWRAQSRDFPSPSFAASPTKQECVTKANGRSENLSNRSLKP